MQQFMTFFRASAYGGAFIFGILLGWSSPAAPKLLNNEESEFFVSSKEFSWIVAFMAIGAALASAISGIFRNILGTKVTVLLVAIPSSLGWLLIIFAKNSAMVRINLSFLALKLI